MGNYTYTPHSFIIQTYETIHKFILSIKIVLDWFELRIGLQSYEVLIFL